MKTKCTERNSVIPNFNCFIMDNKMQEEEIKTHHTPTSEEATASQWTNESESEPNNHICQKRLKSQDNSEDEEMSDSSSSSKRRKVIKSEENQFLDTNILSNNTNGDDGGKFFLNISNLPGQWTCDEVIDYVREECGVAISKVKDYRDSHADFQIKLKFNTEDQRHEVLKKLKKVAREGRIYLELQDSDKKINGDKKIKGDAVTKDNKSDTVSEKTTEIESINDEKEVKAADTQPLPLDIDVRTTDPKGLYGLKESFLASLGVVPPITSWITISNFRCDKSELREVLELAGQVIVCSVQHGPSRYANAMYSHPLEAVQAISMLNGQLFYGQELKVIMVSSVDVQTLLPKGLVSVGPGLGQCGKPERDIVRKYKRYLIGKPSNIDLRVFEHVGILPQASRNSPCNQASTSDGSNTKTGVSPRPVIHNNPNTNTSNRFPNNIPETGISRMPVNIPNNRPNNIPIVGHTTSNVRGPAIGSVSNNTRGPIPVGVPTIRPNPHMRPMNQRPNFPSGPMQPRGPMQIPRGPRGPVGPNGPQMGHMGPRGPRMGPMGPHGPMPMGPMQGPRVIGPPFNTHPVPHPVPPGCMVGVRPELRPSGPVKSVQGMPGPDPTSICLINIPVETTFAIAYENLSKHGVVVALEFTTPGCATVKFSSPMEAEKCLHYFNSTGK